MTEIVKKAISSVNTGVLSFCRFITANDTGSTGAHQSGFYIPKTSYSLFFDQAGIRGTNNDKFIKIKWQNDFETESRAIYYGQKTRNEYRLTRFGKGFPFFEDDYIGSLLIITKQTTDDYQGFVLSEEADIEDFLNEFGMSPVDTNSIIVKGEKVTTGNISVLMDKYVTSLSKRFPDTIDIAEEAKNICTQIYGTDQQSIVGKPDDVIVNWLQTEYELFKKIEIHYYSDQLSRPFSSVDNFTETANSILNRRKSRAGKSLEHHLDTIFNVNRLRFSHPGKTEGNKKPDFIFPGNSEYHDEEFSDNKLVFLGAKTTCKDRWRQILNEASRIPVKHLFTLQQGISTNQLEEIYESQVILVVPNTYISYYPQEYRDKILNLKSFVSYTAEKQRV